MLRIRTGSFVEHGMYHRRRDTRLGLFWANLAIRPILHRKCRLPEHRQRLPNNAGCCCQTNVPYEHRAGTDIDGAGQDAHLYSRSQVRSFGHTTHRACLPHSTIHPGSDLARRLAIAWLVEDVSRGAYATILYSSTQKPAIFCSWSTSH